MSWLCWFNPCQWRHLFNARRDPGAMIVGVNGAAVPQPHVIGIYQCPRCKAISTGVARKDDGKAL